MGVSTVQTVGPAVEFERRFVGDPTTVSWRGPDPRGKFFIARIDSTETVLETEEGNNTIRFIICSESGPSPNCTPTLP